MSKTKSDAELFGCIVEYCTDLPYVNKAQEIASELEHLAKHGASWPRATASHWLRVIKQAIEAGAIVERDGVLGPPKPTQAESLVQRSLFDE
jgi:hypothetical protein